MSHEMTAPSTSMVPAAPGVDVDTSRVGGTPFATFISAKSPRFPELAAAIPGLKEPQVVLIRPQPQRPIRLDPFKVHLITARQFWVESEEDHSLIRVQYNRPEKYSAELKETIEAVVLAYAGNKVFPARVTFKTTKCVGAAVAAKTLKLAASASWADEGPEYAATLQLPMPWARFTATFTCTQQTARFSGRKYWLSNATITPTSESDAATVAAAFKDEEVQATYNAVLASFNRRVAELDAKASE
jgi:hypothetical protein